MAKLIYDFDERLISRKVYIEGENGKREYFPFFDIKVSNVNRTLRLKCWKSQREMAKYFMKVGSGTREAMEAGDKDGDK